MRISEFRQAVKFANAALDRPTADPDDELATVSRQFLRAIEREEARERQHREEYDPHLDLIRSNRDAIMKMYEEAFDRVHRLLKLDKVDLAVAVLDALSLFHPMHGESWKGWPEGSSGKEGD